MLPVFIEFITERWMLAVAWAVVLGLLLLHESRKAGKSVSPQQLSDLVNKQEGLIVDVREHGEYSHGHIAGSVNVPSHELLKRCVEFKDHKEKPVIIVCKIGQHSTSATKQLKAEGYSEVYKLGGGLAEWTASSLPLVKKG